MSIHSVSFRDSINEFLDAVEFVLQVQNHESIINDSSASIIDRAKAYNDLSSIKNNYLSLIYNSDAASAFLIKVLADCSDTLGSVQTGLKYNGENATILTVANNLNNSAAVYTQDVHSDTDLVPDHNSKFWTWSSAGLKVIENVNNPACAPTNYDLHASGTIDQWKSVL